MFYLVFHGDDVQLELALMEPNRATEQWRLNEDGKLGVIMTDHVLETEDLAGVNDLDAVEGIDDFQVARQRVHDVDGRVILIRQLRIGGFQDQLQYAGGEERQAGHYAPEGHAVEGVVQDAEFREARVEYAVEHRYQDEHHRRVHHLHLVGDDLRAQEVSVHVGGLHLSRSTG